MFKRIYNININLKELMQIMATLTSIDAKLDAVLTALASNPNTDNTAVLAAIAALKTDVDTNVEGSAPAPATPAAS